jgi:glycosyltransferase involved in cell wall biosynthesis
MLVTILVCTRDRPDKMKNSLAAILKQEVPPGVDLEVLIVDNGSSSERTRQVCHDLEAAFCSRLRFLHMPVRGKSRAANAGFNSARGEVIAFLDDDILPCENWLRVIYQEFSADSALGGLSGRVELFDQRDLPTGIRSQSMRSIYATAADSYDLFIGCNFAVRRSVIEKYGLYDLDMGPGLRIGSGEDTDFCYRIWKAGVKLVYEPSLFVRHDHGRRSLADQSSILRCYGVARGAVYAKHILQGDRTLARKMYWELGTICRRMFHRNGGQSLHSVVWLLSGGLRYSVIRLCRSLGFLGPAEFLATGSWPPGPAPDTAISDATRQ